MARTNIDIVITVRDGASAPLDNVKNKLKSMGKASKEVSADLTQFNKTLFTSAAFIGTFAKGLSSIKASLEFGAELDKATTQYERVVGPRGDLVKALAKGSNVIVDETAALQSALHLGMLGIVKDGKQAGDILSKMAVAGAMMGKDPTQAMKDLTEASIDGNVAKFQEYGLINKNSAAYMTLTASVNKAGGTYGNMLVKQMQIAMVTKLLTEHTKKHMFMMLSTGQVVESFGTAFTNAKRHIGVFLANAVRPLLEKLIPLIIQFTEFIANAYKTNKNLMFLTKTVLVLTGAVSGFLAVIGTLQLAIKLLGFAGIGLPGLIIATLSLTAGFVGLTKGADGVIKKLELMGAFFKGIYELVSSFDPETGISQISDSTKALLGDLYPFVKMISRVIVIVGTTLRDIWDLLKATGKVVDTAFGGIFRFFTDNFSKFTEGWSTWWTSDAVSDVTKFVRAAAVILGGLFAIGIGKSLFKGAVNLLGKFGIGGGSTKGPKGTSTDPIYTIAAGGALGSGLNRALEIGGLKDLFGLLKQSYTLGGWKQILKDIPAAFSLVFPKLTSVLASIGSIITTAISGIGTSIMKLVPLLGPALAIGASAAAGYLVGSLINYVIDKWFPSVGDAIGKALSKILEWIPGFSAKGDLATDSEARDKADKDFERFEKASNEDLIKEFKAKQGGPRAGNTALQNLSAETSDDTAIVQAVGSQMQGMNQASRENMQSLIESALQSKETTGRFISPEELDGMKNAYAQALKEDENLNAMGAKAKEPITRKMASKRE